MAVITGSSGEFGRLVIEEFTRRAARVAAVLDAALASEADHRSPGSGPTGAPADAGEARPSAATSVTSAEVAADGG